MNFDLIIAMCVFFQMFVETPSAGQWKLCIDDISSLGERGPLTLGPARRIAERNFVIITGKMSFMLLSFQKQNKPIESKLLSLLIYIIKYG